VLLKRNKVELFRVGFEEGQSRGICTRAEAEAFQKMSP
jgi:hypothetical protein